MVTRSFVIASLLLSSACAQRVAVIPARQESMVMRVRVTDDLCPTGDCDEPAAPFCAGPGPEGLSVVDLSLAASHGCLVLSDGHARCWGANYSGQLGEGTAGRQATPTLVIGLEGVVAIRAGQAFTCALTSNGRVSCWGDNGFGQITGGGNMRRTAAEVPGLSGVTQISTGFQHACAVGARGRVSCWGRNHLGQLGNGTRDRYDTPQTVPGLSATYVAAGHDSTCAVRTDGSVACWGGLTVSRRPVLITGLPAPAVTVEVGQASACARLADASVYCWGDGTRGQLGPRVHNISETAVHVDGLPPATALTIWGTRACVADVQHQVWCWGSGEAFDPELASPRMVSHMGPVEAPAMGEEAACARLSEGGLCCWGSNIDGMLGAMQQPFANPPFISQIPVPMLW